MGASLALYGKTAGFFWVNEGFFATKSGRSDGCRMSLVIRTCGLQEAMSGMGFVYIRTATHTHTHATHAIFLVG